MSEVDSVTWDELVGDGPPFLRWDFLSALEAGSCATPERGWLPQHITLRRQGRLACGVDSMMPVILRSWQ